MGAIRAAGFSSRTPRQPRSDIAMVDDAARRDVCLCTTIGSCSGIRVILFIDRVLHSLRPTVAKHRSRCQRSMAGIGMETRMR